LLGAAERSEAANPTTFDNAIQTLLRRQVVRLEAPAVAEPVRKRRLRRSVRPKPVERVYAPGEAWSQLAPLVNRLAAAVRDR
jgi:hypothetical protein